MPKNETQFSDWEIWNGKGEPPTDLVQVHFDGETRKSSEENVAEDAEMFDWDFIIAFRRVIEPVRGEVVLTGYHKTVGCVFSSQNYDGLDTHRLTLPTIDGKLTSGKYTGPDGAVVTVEVTG
jgi:hypothetical protein